ncbi:MAG: AAA family ATPase [Candidatus Micrarchaeota archaeon]
MVFISRLKLRNFKSFKAADIQLPKTFTCFAGPNGSGKSNLCDAIRFAMGEKSLRSLRAKGVRDLIHSGARSAEVTLLFQSADGGPSYEIKRAIREDGKIRYRLNEKKTTRSAILETLKKHNLDESGRNTIAQGEVQRLISMNGKERRAIIDSVAGIADFEAKKKEALAELGTVDTRIKEARLVLGERKAFLEELGREKEIAIKYTEARKALRNAKGTLLRREVEKLEKDLASAVAEEQRLLAIRAERERGIAQVDARIAEVEGKRGKVSEEMQARQKTNSLIRRLEELKASSSSKRQLAEDKAAFLKGAEAEEAKLREEAAAAKEAIEGLEKERQALAEQLAKAEAELSALGGFAQDDEVSAARAALGKKEEELASARETLVMINSEIGAKSQLIAAKKEELHSALPESVSGDEAEDPQPLQREAERLAREIDRSFSRTKEINGQMADLDRQMLELKEKASIHKVRSSPHLANPALSFIAELMKDRKAGNGIYGTMADLITFDPKHSAAIEAAGGSRLLYVVVDSVDTANGIISKLKAAKAGRATFIPLDSIRTPPPAKAGGFSSVIGVVEFREEIRKAAEYVFADTLLVPGVAEAKRLGIGSARMVTEEGEIFERSGIMSGGRSQGSVLNANAQKKIEAELAEVKATKDSMMQQLYSIREDESRLRGEKAQLEIRIKTIEMKRRMEEERRKENEQLYARRDQLREETARLEESVRAREAEKKRIEASLASLSEAVAQAKARLASAESESRESAEQSSRRRADLSAEVSSLRATMEGKASESGLHKSGLASRNERLQRLAKERAEALAKIDEVRKQAAKEEAEVAALEEKISSASKEIEKLFEELKGHEAALQELGGRRGALRMEAEKVGRDISQAAIKKATTTTRLEDIGAEFASFADSEQAEGSREELTKIVAESERTLATLGNVNMAAIEMFDRKKAEIEDVESRIGKLETEREAILSMIGEIDEHKKDAFFEAFEAISSNFSGMFKHVNVGQGHLALSDQANPFESGLFIKLRRNNQDHSLDALSGGEKTLVALMFIFALQLFKPAPFYILDEVDAALDKPNSRNLADLVARMSNDSQFIVVSHNDTVMSHSDSVIGVTKAEGGSKLVGIKLKQVAAA